jgi:hypothetical protein
MSFFVFNQNLLYLCGMKKILLPLIFLLSVASCSKDESDPTHSQNNSNQNNSTTTPTVQNNCRSAQCVSSTQQNVRCQRMTTYCNQKCWQHQ